MQTGQTIVAVSSAGGVGARGIVRLVVGEAHPIVLELMGEKSREVVSGEAGWQVWPSVGAWVYGFVSPRSYTGEDLVEIPSSWGSGARRIAASTS